MARTQIRFDNTRLIFKTNFSGDPSRDKYGSNKRRVNIIIPTKEQADMLASMNVKVRQTRPNPNKTYENGFTPTYFVGLTIKMDSKFPPKIYWITPKGARVECDADMLGKLDYIRIKNVNCVANLVENKNRPGDFSLYASVMYVEQDVDYDPYAEMYRNRVTNSSSNEYGDVIAPAEED